MSKDRELYNCFFTKTVLMLMIVLYHSILAWSGNWFQAVEVSVEKPLAIIANYFNSFHIYAFVLVSGYIFYYAKCECGKYDSFVAFAINKFKRLIVPYITVSAIWVIPIGAFFFKYNFEEVVTKYVLAISPNQLWFLVMLFGVFLVFWPLTSFMKKHFKCGLFVAVVFYAFGVLGSALLPNVFQIWTIFKYVIFFWLGFVIRQYKLTKYKNTWPLWVVVHMALFVLSRVIQDFNDNYVMKTVNIGCEFAVHIVGAIMAFALMQSIGSRIDKQPGILSSLGKKSMPVYLFHQQIIYVTIYMLNGLVSPYIHSIINFVVAMILSFALSAMLMRFKATSFLIGEKYTTKEV